MSLPYFPLYPRDFEADTSHLTLEEDGAYNRLLRLCWMTPGCSLPDDDAWIMRRMRCDDETYERVVLVVLGEFFRRENGRVSNARLTRESDTSNEKHQRRVAAGSIGGKSKALKTKVVTHSNARAMPKQPEPEPEEDKREAKASPKKRRQPETELPEGWVPNDQNINDAEAKGFTATEIDHEADSFRNHHHSKQSRYRDWNAAWRTWISNAIKFGRRGGVAGGQAPGGYGQGSSIASIVARRRADGKV